MHKSLLRTIWMILGQAPLDRLLQILTEVVGLVGVVLADSGLDKHGLPAIIEGALDISVDIVADHHILFGLTIELVEVAMHIFEGVACRLTVVGDMKLTFIDFSVDSLKGHVKWFQQQPRQRVVLAPEPQVVQSRVDRDVRFVCHVLIPRAYPSVISRQHVQDDLDALLPAYRAVKGADDIKFQCMKVQNLKIKTLFDFLGDGLNNLWRPFSEGNCLREYRTVLVYSNVVRNLLKGQNIIDFLPPDEEHQLIMPMVECIFDGCIVEYDLFFADGGLQAQEFSNLIGFSLLVLGGVVGKEHEWDLALLEQLDPLGRPFELLFVLHKHTVDIDDGAELVFG